MAGPIVDSTLATRQFGAVARRLPTGAKIFIILAVVLFFPAIIAVTASLRTTQLANQSVRAQLRVAGSESARRVAIELIGDMTALRTAMNSLAIDKADAPTCARVQGVFAQQVASGTQFQITDRAGRVLCGTALPAEAAPAPPRAGTEIVARLLPDRGVTLSSVSSDRDIRGSAFFPVPFLAEVARPTNFSEPYESVLVAPDAQVTITPLPERSTLERRETFRLGLGVDALQLQTSIRSAPITSPVVLAMMLPLLMWAAAAGLSWFVVDRLLIRPLRHLRTDVAAWQPGQIIDPAAVHVLPAQEIRDLGDTFRTMSATVAAHEAGLAEGLVRQTKLTREVHHRVKNNLQVISSLINFHARSSRSEEATVAYASIQRRVDALAVVHRYHFAEMEDNRGLSLRSVLGELAANLRATAPEGSALAIGVDIQSVHVTQDVAVAVAFLVTELIELASGINPAAQVRISVKPAEDEGRAIVRVSSPALVDSDMLREALSERYGRIIEGLSRQLRSKLHSDPLVGAFEISIAMLGTD